MAIAKAATQVTWATAASLSVAGGGTGTSDAVAIGGTVIDGSIQLKADHSGTPAAGDTVEFYMLATNGDPDADPDSADEYDTAEQGTLLAVLDLNADDPAIKTVPLPTVSIDSLKIYAVNNDAADAVTVSAQLYLTTSS